MTRCIPHLATYFLHPLFNASLHRSYYEHISSTPFVLSPSSSITPLRSYTHSLIRPSPVSRV